MRAGRRFTKLTTGAAAREAVPTGAEAEGKVVTTQPGGGVTAGRCSGGILSSHWGAGAAALGSGSKAAGSSATAGVEGSAGDAVHSITITKVHTEASTPVRKSRHSSADQFKRGEGGR